MSTTATSGTKENVYLFVPNIIGYIRIILATCSLYYMPWHPRYCSLLYAVSCLLDAADGLAARIFKQSTQYGAVLDMVTDRCTTTCLIVFLAKAIPEYAVLFQALISLDYASHYVHMYASLATGAGSHKNVSTEKSRLLNFYYRKSVLFVCCAMNELFFIGWYLLCFTSLKERGTSLLFADTLKPYFRPQPADVPSSTVNFVAGRLLDDTIPWVVTICSLPVMLFKQIINVVQLVKAFRQLANTDIQARMQAQVQKSE